MERLDLLKRLSFGKQVAEDEVSELADYFVETDQWSRMVRGDIDVVRGEKGSGKSAIYALLMARANEFFDRRVLMVAGEEPRGDTVFKDLLLDPPTTEEEFITLWKVYLITIVAQELREYGIADVSGELFNTLEDAGLLVRQWNLPGLLRRAQDLARRLLKAEFSSKLELDPVTGTPSGITGRILLREPTQDLSDKGYRSIDRLFKYANDALEASNFSIWLLLDRLDVAFAEDHILEANALRALLRVYNGLKKHPRIKLKIFLREDIWRKLFEGGFREASHINDYVVLAWNANSLANLIVRRLLNNKALLAEFKIDAEGVLKDVEAQTALLNRLLPRQVEQGPQKPPTFKWMVSRCADATDNTAPRELIHLLKSLQEQEIQRLERGGSQAPEDQLFDRSVFKAALVPVSRARLNQYLYAEYPEYRSVVSALERQKSEQSIESLVRIWRVDNEEAERKAEALREIGFFQKRTRRQGDSKETYWVPFLYRDSLNMVQGREED